MGRERNLVVLPLSLTSFSFGLPARIPVWTVIARWLSSRAVKEGCHACLLCEFAFIAVLCTGRGDVDGKWRWLPLLVYITRSVQTSVGPWKSPGIPVHWPPSVFLFLLCFSLSTLFYTFLGANTLERTERETALTARMCPSVWCLINCGSSSSSPFNLFERSSFPIPF
ncbi:hypothetical protein BJV82DRAFT_229278 [Fennellomyces sp. T-0311]|nr:hypothetical protein BJV82DRAFT_229278 [Fennellomyces sp. T-0311]